jgi:hypothetical protein
MSSNGNHPHTNGSTPDGQFATAETVNGLAREMQALRRKLDPLPDRIDELAVLVTKLADQLAEHLGTSETTAVPSWLMLPTDPDAALTMLSNLLAWLDSVYLRYTDAANGLPDCWLWHPDVVEELLWLQHAWLAAYQGAQASIQAAGDWHDRYRPGVVRRIKDTHGRCSLERHQTRRGEAPETGGRAVTAPLAEAAELLATWWAHARDSAPPEPTAEHLAASPRDTLRGGR